MIPLDIKRQPFTSFQMCALLLVSQGAALLDQAAQVASKLSQVSCAHSGPPSVGSAGLPHVLLRRIITAVLHVLYEEAGKQGKHGETCRKTITQVERDKFRCFLLLDPLTALRLV